MKIRTDFVTNSSSSSFLFEIKVKLKTGKTIKLSSYNDEDNGVEFNVYTSPKQWAQAKSIDELVDMIKKSTYMDWNKSRPYFGSNVRSAWFLGDIRKLNSMEDIESITISGDEQNYKNYYRWYQYDLTTGEYLYKVKGESFEKDGSSGGDFYFTDTKTAKPYEQRVKTKRPSTVTSTMDENKVKDIVSGKSDVIEGKTFVVTGKLLYFFSRNELKAFMEDNGAKLSETLNASTDYLITNDPDSGSSKNMKAQQLGTKIITEEDFLNLTATSKNKTETKIDDKKDDNTLVISGIKEIKNNAYKNHLDITSIKIKGDVKVIGKYAFGGCSSLKTVILHEGIEKISDSAFCKCEKLKQIVIPETIKVIGKRAFSGCKSLSRVVFSRGLTQIEASAFEKCEKLLDIRIPEGVTSIGDFAFSKCKSLSSVDCSKDLKEIGRYAFEACEKLKNIQIPESVTSIGDCAFIKCKSLEKFRFPESITDIGGGVFTGCTALKKVSIPSNIEFITRELFYGCKSLSEVVLPDGLLEISDMAFSGCSALSTVYIPDSVLLIGDSVFENCKALSEVRLSNNLENIGDDVFAGCSKLICHKAVNAEFLGNEKNPYLCLVRNRSIVGNVYTIPEKTKFILDRALYGASYDKVVLPKNLKGIGSAAFAHCDGIRCFELGDSLKYIRANAFLNANSLEKIFLPNTVKEIGFMAFLGCPLREIVFGGTKEQFEEMMKQARRDIREQFEERLKAFRQGFGWRNMYEGLSALKDCMVKCVDGELQY